MRKRERVSENFRPVLRERARSMRQEMSRPETLLWSRIKGDQLDGLRFRRQKVIGPYVADFSCPALNLIVEVDGDSHAHPDQACKDNERTTYFQRFRLQVLRFTNSDVLTNIDGVLIELLRVATALRAHPSPPPAPRRTGARGNVVRLNRVAGDDA